MDLRKMLRFLDQSNVTKCLHCGFLSLHGAELKNADRYLIPTGSTTIDSPFEEITCSKSLWMEYDIDPSSRIPDAIFDEVCLKDRRNCASFIKYMPGRSPKGHLELEKKKYSNIKKMIMTVTAGLLVLVIWNIFNLFFRDDEPKLPPKTTNTTKEPTKDKGDEDIIFEENKLEPTPEATNTIEEIIVKQEGKNLKNVTGFDISPGPRDLELGKIQIDQKSETMENVTGLKVKFDNNSGEIELTDKVEIIQKTPRGQNSVTINADLPGVKVIFNKKSKKDENSK